MESTDTKGKPTYEQFREEWLKEIEDADLAPLEKGIRFASKLVPQWLEVTTDDDDFVICDGSGDGGIDIAYLQRADKSSEGQGKDLDTIEGDTWYIVQSKYGSAFTGSDTILKEGNKVLTTLQGHSKGLSSDTQQLLKKLAQFRKQALGGADRIELVFATTDPITQQDRQALERIKILGREQIMEGFDVKNISLKTIWEAQDEIEQPKLSVPINGQFVEQYSNLLVGTVSLLQLFEFLKSYESKTGNLDQIYEKNVRKFLGKGTKINRRIAETLEKNPELFGLYNNGITIVVSGYEKKPGDGTGYSMNDPYIVNGCQTTRTIWQVLDSKINAGGTGTDTTSESWKERAGRGGVVTKIVTGNELELPNITRYTNSQNSIREQYFIALEDDFRRWADEMKENYNIFLEIQRGGTESQKAWEKQHPDVKRLDDYVNAFDLVKVYGAGWLSVPGTAFRTNPPFLPDGPVYQRMLKRESTEPAFGASDLYAAYKIKSAADARGFGRNPKSPSRRLSRFLFYHVIMRTLHSVIEISPELPHPIVYPSVLTDAVIRLGSTEAQAQFDTLCDSAVTLIDQYLALSEEKSAYKEPSYTQIHNGDLNSFLKSEDLGKENHSPLLIQLLDAQKLSFGSIRMPMYEGSPTQREFVAQALLDQ